MRPRSDVEAKHYKPKQTEKLKLIGENSEICSAVQNKEDLKVARNLSKGTYSGLGDQGH